MPQPQAFMARPPFERIRPATTTGRHWKNVGVCFGSLVVLASISLMALPAKRPVYGVASEIDLHPESGTAVTVVSPPETEEAPTETPALDIASNSLVEDSLNGGYLQAMYMAKTGVGTVLPFVRWQYFDGANKAETNAPMNHVNDLEIGVEWQIAREVELSAIFHRMKRNNLVTGNRAGRPDYAEFEADALRLQLQFNYQ